jgi:hypothetical protein
MEHFEEEEKEEKDVGSGVAKSGKCTYLSMHPPTISWYMG